MFAETLYCRGVLQFVKHSTHSTSNVAATTSVVLLFRMPFGSHSKYVWIRTLAVTTTDLSFVRYKQLVTVAPVRKTGLSQIGELLTLPLKDVRPPPPQ